MTDEPIGRMVGLHYCDKNCQYDIGKITSRLIDALGVGILAVEQIVTGEKLIKSMHIGDFYEAIDACLEEYKGSGSESAHGDVDGLREEIEALNELIGQARTVAKVPRPRR